MQDTADLSTSKLGTKKYWDELYALELENFRRNPQDTGDCWFSDSDAEQKMIDFLVDNIGAYRITEDASVVDLGTGNGHLLFELHETEFQGKLVGIDYSEESVKLATNIAEATGVEDFISFQQADIFNSGWNPGKFDVVLDKGTLDAISLSGIKINGKLDVVDVYAGVVEKILKKDSIF
ncbi:YIL064W-like protein [Saccharomyces cerevisiae x Saccharomyces kudriavzevii VIN7]|uniref:YIL064W-like protein n=1 Tax=Saccharomyces cerevisiae x Saccharomyces kudriavzevii (strain VIN7) TaxID=1095631 RepID=H0GWA7_SACCK|nr:YIL064W-like protein [Saccharomyces cerevisiae x Saccharomyces kudriavzevii VIN7]